MTKGMFLSEEEVLDLFGRLDRLENLIRNTTNAIPEWKVEEATMLNRKAAAYYISTGRLPQDLDSPPTKGLTRFDIMVGRGLIKCIPTGDRKKLFRKADLDSFIYRYNS